ncbi:MAG: hypothetical protein EOM24_37780 [Chloroflexia bacterium]|nr:hypothetical protein [Chloroflexia bacterium]
MTSAIKRRVESLESQSCSPIDAEFLARLDDEERAFYLRMTAREAAHPQGFDGLVKTLTKDELVRSLAILVKRLVGADLAEETRTDASCSIAPREPTA